MIMAKPIKKLIPEDFKPDFVENPRSLRGFTPSSHAVTLRVIHPDIKKILFGSRHYSFNRPSSMPDDRWEEIERMLWLVDSSYATPHHFVVTIQHVFIEEILPELLQYHAQDGIYASEFNRCIKQELSQKWEPGETLRAYELESLLKSCRSAQYFQPEDPACILNDLRSIRNGIIHEGLSSGDLERWGGIYLRYYEALLETLKLVSVAS